MSGYNSVTQGYLGGGASGGGSSPRNYNKAQVESSASAFVAVASQCVLIFKSGATGSIQLLDNKWNEWVIYNNSGANKQLVGAIANYRTQTGTLKNYVSSGSVLNLAKGTDNIWYEVDNGTATSGNTKPPLIIEVGATGGPVAGLNDYQNDKLIGLGSTNGDKIQLTIDDTQFSNFGTNSNFSFNSTTGTISGIFWVDGSGLYVDLNQ